MNITGLFDRFSAWLQKDYVPYTYTPTTSSDKWRVAFCYQNNYRAARVVDVHAASYGDAILIAETMPRRQWKDDATVKWCWDWAGYRAWRLDADPLAPQAAGEQDLASSNHVKAGFCPICDNTIYAMNDVYPPKCETCDVSFLPRTTADQRLASITA